MKRGAKDPRKSTQNDFCKIVIQNNSEEKKKQMSQELIRQTQKIVKCHR